jgi:hypothetical protein
LTAGLRLFAALAVAVLSLAGRPAAAQDAVANQRAFEQAMRAQAQGEVLESIAMLSALSEKTDAPRVRLELGRALFITGQYARARNAFGEVYRQDLPYPVRRSVNVYLDEIDQRIGFVRPSFGLAIDNNPTHAAARGVYDILGSPFTFDSTAESAIGATYGLDALRPLGRSADGQLSAVASIEGAAFDDQAADHVGGTVGLRYDHFRKRSRITVGWRAFHNSNVEASAPFVEYYRRWAPRRDRQFSVRTSIELNHFRDHLDIDGETVRGAINYARDFGVDTTVQAGMGASLSTITNSLLPTRTVSGQIGVSRSFRRAKTNLISTVSLTRSTFGDVDPFFGARRQDLSQRVDVAIYSGRPVWSLFPGMVLTYEHQGSTIDFYGYDRAGVSVDFRRRF